MLNLVVIMIIVIITTVSPVDDVQDGNRNSNDKGSNHNDKSSNHQSLGILVSTGHNKCLQQFCISHYFIPCDLLLTYCNGEAEGNKSQWPTEATGNWGQYEQRDQWTTILGSIVGCVWLVHYVSWLQQWHQWWYHMSNNKSWDYLSSDSVSSWIWSHRIFFRWNILVRWQHRWLTSCIR